MTQRKKDKTKKNTEPESFPIVGIGASAGGLEAFKEFFPVCLAVLWLLA